MTTSTSPTLPLGTALTFTHAGECVVGGRVSRARGTTVKVERLFEQLPVRRKELVKNAKREMAKAIELVQAYALVKTGVRFEVRNIVKGSVCPPSGEYICSGMGRLTEDEWPSSAMAGNLKSTCRLRPR